MTQIPIARGLTVCENVIVEERTHNLTLVNCFTIKCSATFPADNIRFVAVTFLSDGDGEIPMKIITFRDRIQEVRFFLRIERCVFPVPGHYQSKLLAEGEEIAQQRFRILPLETSP